MDVELTELILQNEISLELIRNVSSVPTCKWLCWSAKEPMLFVAVLQDIKNTKKEWELQFQQAKDRERDRVRPSTSLGIPSASPSTNGATRPGRESPRVCCRRWLELTPLDAGKPIRQIHTSAGFRSAGPQVQLLRQAAPTSDTSSFSPVSSLASKTSRSTTADILTL